MAQSGSTPIQLYYSTTPSAVPSAADLLPGELGLNIADGKLYYENASGVVQQLAGLSGFSGVSGASGVSGFSGVNGASGVSGFSGSGISGFSGSGISGVSGYSGLSGFSGTPGGSNTQIQFNNSGSFGGNSNFTIDNSTGVVTHGKNTLINGTSYGAGNNGLANNIAIGNFALGNSGFSGGYSIAIGAYALGNGAAAGGSLHNVAIGYLASYQNTTGTNNISIGKDAGSANTIGANNINIGPSAGLNFNKSTGDQNSYNIFIGTNAGNGQAGSSTGQYNLAIGAGSAYALTTGYGNILIGTGYGPYGTSAAGFLITTGNRNVVIGNYDGVSGVSGADSPDIRTASGYIVFADGQGVVRGYSDNTSNWKFNKINGTDIVQRVVAIADGISVTMNCDTTDIATQTNTQAAGTLTINAPTGTPVNGQKLIFRLKSSYTQTFSWNAIFTGSSDLSLPSTGSGSGGTAKTDYMGFIYNSDASKWQLLAKNFGFS